MGGARARLRGPRAVLPRLVIASWAARQFQAEISGMLEFPYWMDTGLGLRTVVLALCLGVVCTGVACLVPALKASAIIVCNIELKCQC